MMVKICGITNREDALAAAEAGASAIGFNFYRESPRYVSPTGAAMIVEKLPAGLLKIGVFVDEGPERIAHIALETGLDVAQLHGASVCSALVSWRACPVDDYLDEECLREEADAEAILLDGVAPRLRGGTGNSFDWRLAREAAARTSKKIVIAGGLGPENVQRAIEEGRPWGVDACSRIESAPGRKDHAKMKKFIQTALATAL